MYRHFITSVLKSVKKRTWAKIANYGHWLVDCTGDGTFATGRKCRRRVVGKDNDNQMDGTGAMALMYGLSVGDGRHT